MTDDPTQLVAYVTGPLGTAVLGAAAWVSARIARLDVRLEALERRIDRAEHDVASVRSRVSTMPPLEGA